MPKLIRMIEKAKSDREYFSRQFRVERVRGASIEAAACAIRQRALEDARNAILEEGR